MGAKEIVIGIIGVAAVVAVLFWWDRRVQPSLDKFQATHQYGRPDGSILLDDLLILVDRVGVLRNNVTGDTTTTLSRVRDEDRARLTVIDRASGAKLATHLAPPGNCQAATANRLWCVFDKLELDDARTMKRVLDVETAIGKSGGGRPVSGVWRIDGARAVHLLDDGRVAIIDAASGAVTHDDAVPPSLRSEPMINRAPAPGHIAGMSPFSPCAGGGAAAAAMFAPHGTAEDFLPPGVHKKKKVAPAPPIKWTVLAAISDRAHIGKGSTQSSESFLRPVLLGTLEPPLFLHHTSLDAQRDSLQISRLSDSGAIAWTHDLQTSGCENIETTGPFWIVTTANPAHRAVALDPQTGAQRWEVSF